MMKFLFFFLFSIQSFANSNTWTIATLEWPPFICSNCAAGGAAGAALKKVLATNNIDIEFKFYPWIQAQKLGAQLPFVGYFPAWEEEILPGFIPSEALFSSPVVFLERKDKPLKWHHLSDLIGKTFVVTEGYGNTREFNSLVRSGLIKTIAVLNEESSFHKLANGKVDGILIDYNVAKYYLRNIYPQYAKLIQVNERIIERKSLYMVFNSHNKDKQEKLQTLLKTVNFQRLVDDLNNESIRPK